MTHQFNSRQTHSIFQDLNDITEWSAGVAVKVTLDVVGGGGLNALRLSGLNTTSEEELGRVRVRASRVGRDLYRHAGETTASVETCRAGGAVAILAARGSTFLGVSTGPAALGTLEASTVILAEVAACRAIVSCITCFGRARA